MEELHAIVRDTWLRGRKLQEGKVDQRVHGRGIIALSIIGGESPNSLPRARNRDIHSTPLIWFGTTILTVQNMI